MVLLICGALVMSSIMWGLLFRLSVFNVVKLAVLMILRDFVGTGIVVATFVWYDDTRIYGTNTFDLRLPYPRLFSRFILLPRTTVSHQTDAKLEWAYAFDVHTNSFVPLYTLLYLIQFFLSPLIVRDRWVCLWLANSLYLGA